MLVSGAASALRNVPRRTCSANDTRPPLHLVAALRAPVRLGGCKVIQAEPESFGDFIDPPNRAHSQFSDLSAGEIARQQAADDCPVAVIRTWGDSFAFKRFPRHRVSRGAPSAASSAARQRPCNARRPINPASRGFSEKVSGVGRHAPRVSASCQAKRLQLERCSRRRRRCAEEGRSFCARVSRRLRVAASMGVDAMAPQTKNYASRAVGGTPNGTLRSPALLKAADVLRRRMHNRRVIHARVTRSLLPTGLLIRRSQVRILPGVLKKHRVLQ